MLRYGFVAILLLPLLLKGQDVKLLSQEIGTIFKDLRPAERKVLVEEGVNTWTSSFFSDAEKEEITSVFKELLAIPTPVSPELKNFADCINAFCRRSEKENFNVWLEGLKTAMKAPERKRTIIKNYLVAAVPVVCGQTLFNTSNQKWLVRGKAEWNSGDEIRIFFKDCDVICKTAKDSIKIYHTTVSYILQEDKFTGNGGLVKWGDPGDAMSAELSSYTVDMKMSQYTADSVFFRYEGKFDGAFCGKLKDNASKYDRGKNEPYPEFVSYAQDIGIDSLFPGISFRGGISYAGMKLSGVGTMQQPAYLHISPDDTVHMYLYSKRFVIDSAKITSGSSGLVIDLDSGQITHSDVNFVYTAGNNSVVVKRITEESLQVPFKDSYHQILFDMEQILWPLDSNKMAMSMNSRTGLFNATIESQNFFSDDVYDKIQGMDDINPLNGLLKCSMKMNSKTFTVKEYAAFMKRPVEQLRKQLILLSYKDFLEFNEAEDKVSLKQRLFDYTLARVGKLDYDNIRFASHPKNSRINALLDVKNFNLEIFGVDKFTISSTKNVFVEPVDKSVIMMKNRDMIFNGKLQAGMFDLFGRDLFFSYDRYTVDLTRSDSAGMYLADRMTRQRGKKINSQLRNITGEIVIDKPNNKSGTQDNLSFPVLNSTQDSYVYFDNTSIQNGEYKRDSFYYVVKPYVMKGIDDSDKFRYAFDGTLVSNIVSPIRDSLRLMEDNTLGMVYKTPDAGLELYGKGRIKSNIKLDHNGFMASGNVDMNRSNFQSDSILMLPSLMTARTKIIEVSQVELQRPAAMGEHAVIKYLPKAESLQATSTRKPFEVYQGRVKHSGTLFIYDRLMDASGKLEVKDAEMKSSLFNLQANNILSQRMDLLISSISNENIRLNTTDVAADIDLVNNKGKFVNNTKNNKVDFLSNRYACTFKSFTWYMNESYLNIGIEDELELARLWKIENTDSIPEQGKNIFVSTDRQTDSLRFIAPFARYTLTDGSIDCQWVNHIDVANGRFYPDRGNIYINSQGDVREFTAGRLLCELKDSSSKILANVAFKLKGRYAFNGKGDVDYINEDDKKSILHFSEIGVDSVRLIYAKAELTPEEPLLLNEGICYKGNVILNSREKHFFFKGYAGLTTGKELLKHTWIKVNSSLDEKRVRIPVQTENRDDQNERIFNGVFLTMDKETKPYVAFLGKRAFYADDLIIGGHGDLVWSGKEKRYIISDTTVDRYYNLCYNTLSSSISGFGKQNLVLNIPGIYQNMAGDVSYSLENEKLRFDNLLYMVDFRLLKKMETILSKDLSSDTRLKAIAQDSSLTAKLSAVYGKGAMPAVSKILARSSANVPDSLNRLFVFDNMHMEWNNSTRSYVSNGKPKIKAMLGKPLEKEMNVKVELQRQRTGDELFIYIYDDNVWYYFEYSGKALYTLSSNGEYNDTLKNEKAENKVIRDQDKEILYTLTLCPDSKRERFLSRIK